MFALGIRYLNGWALAAADGAKKEQAEWPPHPDRVFMALAAAWFETGEAPEEGEALRWLEALPPPSIAASTFKTRTSVVSYVPVNDATTAGRIPKSLHKLRTLKKLEKLKETGLSVLPEYRLRKPRGFPVAIPENPTVYLIWPEIKLGEYRKKLGQLATKVTHVGHSSSFVQAWVEENNNAVITWEPTERITNHKSQIYNFRVPVAGRLDNLIKTYNRAKILEYVDLKKKADSAKGKERTELNRAIKERFTPVPISHRPTPVRWQGYNQPEEDKPPETIGSVFDKNLIILSIKDKRIPLSATLKFTQALRGALMKSCPNQPPPEWFSGHTPDGAPTAEPHLALFPLPFVGRQHADGRIMGFALALPDKLNPSDARHCLGKFLHDSSTGQPQEHKLFTSHWFECTVELDTRENPPYNLKEDTWVKSSCVWASVTPVVLNRHFDGKSKWRQAAQSVKAACKHIGLPEPREVLLHPISLVEGAPPAREYPKLVRKSDGGKQGQSHAVIIFDEPVHGPILIGAGRFRGYGLCRPIKDY